MAKGVKKKDDELERRIKQDPYTKYAVIECYHIRPEKQLTYDDVKNTITDDFKSYYRTKINNEIVKTLQNKYKPRINQDVLAKLISPN